MLCDFWFYGSLKDLEFTIKNERNLTDLKGVKKARKHIKPRVGLSLLMLTGSCSIVPDVRRLHCCR